MPRRVIYIKNPTNGSHFRTLGGGGSSSGGGRTRTPKGPKAPKQPKPLPPPPHSPGGSAVLTGGAIYSTPASDWFIAQPSIPSPYYGTLPGYGIGPYAQTFTEFRPAETFLGAMYYMFVLGIDPNTGDTMPPHDTPGILTFGAGTEWQSLQYEQFDRNPGKKAPGFFGGVGVKNIPSGLRNKSPSRFDISQYIKRYEENQ